MLQALQLCFKSRHPLHELPFPVRGRKLRRIHRGRSSAPPYLSGGLVHGLLQVCSTASVTPSTSHPMHAHAATRMHGQAVSSDQVMYLHVPIACAHVESSQVDQISDIRRGLPASRSAGSSMPTETLMRSSGRPREARTAAGMLAWLM